VDADQPCLARPPRRAGRALHDIDDCTAGRQVPGLLIYRYDACCGSLHAGRALVGCLRVVRADLVVTDVGRVTLPPNAATERSVDGRWEDAGETEQDAGKWS
jgi:hypothetical protein